MTVTNKTCPFNEKRTCDNTCQLFINSKCAFAVIADTLARAERTLKEIEKTKKIKS